MADQLNNFPPDINQSKPELNWRLADVSFFMLKWAITCLIAAMIAGTLGYNVGLAEEATAVAKFLFYLLIGIFILLLIIGIIRGSRFTE